MTSPLRVLVAGCGNMGASHARAYHKMPEFEIVGLVSRGPTSRGAAQQRAGRPARVRRLLRGPCRHQARRRQHQHLPRDARAVCESGNRCGLSRVLRKAAGRDRRGGSEHRRPGAREPPQAGRRIHPARSPGLDPVHRNRAHARQTARHADEPESAEPRARVEHPPEAHGVDEPDRRLRRPLRRRHVPDDGRQAGARVGCRRASERRAQARHVQLRPATGHVRRWVGGLVRGRLGPDDERGGVLRQGRHRPQGVRVDCEGPERNERQQARTTSTATRKRTASSCTTPASTRTTSS